MKTSLAILLISLVCQACFGQATNIDGIFGIKLGQPLPASCTNSQTSFDQPDEWGFQNVDDVVPPMPNSEFTNFVAFVELTPTNHLVCEINIQNVGMNSSTYAGVLEALRHHYGPEDDTLSGKVADVDDRVWSISHKSLTLMYLSSGSSPTAFLTCKDNLLLSHPPHVTDTNGL